MQKIADAVSNADPDVLTKLTGALGAGQGQLLTDGQQTERDHRRRRKCQASPRRWSTHSGYQSVDRANGDRRDHACVDWRSRPKQDPSIWSDGGAIGSLFASQKNAIAAALPADLAKTLGASGLLQGLGAAGAAVASNASSASNAAGAAVSQARAASGSSGFPMWAIIVIVVIVLAALYWFFVMKKEEAKPAVTMSARRRSTMWRRRMAHGFPQVARARPLRKTQFYLRQSCFKVARHTVSSA